MSEPEPRHVGRPRSRDADEAILRATAELLAEVGLAGTTIRAVAERSGVARATIYLRWPSRDALIGAALRHAIGREPVVVTGNFDADFRAGAEQARAIFARGTFQAVLPSLVRELLRGDRGEGTPLFDRLFPARERFAEEYRRGAESAGLRIDVDEQLAFDLLAGAHLVHLLATGRSATRIYGQRAAEVILAGLHASAVDSGPRRSSR
jgi:AcrR family transcriptional regulator